LARIAGVNLPVNKRALVSLTYIHGIGPKFAMDIPDYQDIYVPKGRTQKIRINLTTSNQESLD